MSGKQMRSVFFTEEQINAAIKQAVSDIQNRELNPVEKLWGGEQQRELSAALMPVLMRWHLEGLNHNIQPEEFTRALIASLAFGVFNLTLAHPTETFGEMIGGFCFELMQTICEMRRVYDEAGGPDSPNTRTVNGELMVGRPS